MVKKRYFILWGVIIYLLCMASFRVSYAYEGDKKLVYSNNRDILTNELKDYIDKIDNSLVPNATFTYSDILINNYDSLVNFASNYIYLNKNRYNKDIVYKDYIPYVPKEVIYDITENYFNVKYFYIDDFIEIKSLSTEFELEIISINYIQVDDNKIKVNVIYENKVEYNYIFIYDSSNNMYLYNIEVVL